MLAEVLVPIAAGVKAGGVSAGVGQEGSLETSVAGGGCCTPLRSIFYNMAEGGWQVRGGL